MKIFLTLLILFITLHFKSLSQSNVEINRAKFLNGIQLENPYYNFQWKFEMKEFPKDKFLNLKIKKIKFSAWTTITFDSAIFLNNYLLSKCYISITSKKNDSIFKMQEFGAFVDFETIDRMAIFFNFHFGKGGWIFFPEEYPFYKLRLYKNKKLAAIVISKI